MVTLAHGPLSFSVFSVAVCFFSSFFLYLLGCNFDTWAPLFFLFFSVADFFFVCGGRKQGALVRLDRLVIFSPKAPDIIMDYRMILGPQMQVQLFRLQCEMD